MYSRLVILALQTDEAARLASSRALSTAHSGIVSSADETVLAAERTNAP